MRRAPSAVLCVGLGLALGFFGGISGMGAMDENHMEDMGHDHTMFRALICNENLTMATCVAWSSMGFELSSEVTIPCGSCVTMDESGELALSGGLNVMGRLHFPSADLVRITAPHVFVQGELSIDTPDSLVPSPTNKGVEFVVTGTDDVTFAPHMDNMMACPVGGCNVSKKPVVVAGGRLDVRGVDETCPSWVRLADVERAGSVEAQSYPAAPVPKASPCGGMLVDQDFEDPNDPDLAAHWDGNGAAHALETDAAEGNSFLRVLGRSSGWHGPSVKLDVGCIVPGETYLLSFKFRLHRPDGTPTLAETSGSVNVPYINMLRKDVDPNVMDAWITQPCQRGDLGTAVDNVWHTQHLTLDMKEQWADSAQTSVLRMYLNTLDADAVVDLDDFRLELAPASVFPASSADACRGLLRNGNVDQANGHTYPFQASLGLLESVHDGDGPLGHAGPYIRWSLRKSIYSYFTQQLNTACLADGVVYEFRAAYRIHSPTPRKLNVQLQVQRDGQEDAYMGVASCPESIDGLWTECAQRFLFDDLAGADSVALFISAPGDESSVVDFADVSMDYVPEHGPARALIPDDPAVASCWAPGGEILVTSHTIQWDDGRTATIASVDPTTGALTLAEPIPAPTTIADDLDTAVEVALLNRNVRFVAADDDAASPISDGHGHGGHIMVMHTPAPVIQLFRGAEVRGFGQQGLLGRYPIHFHMCNSVMGSVVSKNVIRNSNQRCVVVHNTDMLQISENVAFNTSGHCFILEDGGEQHNTFRGNLGATTRAVQKRISDNESDNLPSTFWLTNPANTFIGNVAAGSNGAGYWFEVSSAVRGPSRELHPSMIPNQLPLQLFKDNVAHSNHHNGLQTYPQTGYRPPELAVFRNFKSYRNRGSGVFFHAGGRLGIDGGFMADNRIGIDIDADHSDVITNTRIIGVSDSYRTVIKNMGLEVEKYPARTHCTGGPLRGIRLDSYYKGGSDATGTRVENVTLSGYGSGGCDNSTAFDVDGNKIEFFDPRNRLKGLAFLDDSAKIDLSDADAEGIVDVAIRDVDGSFMGTPGFVVSDHPAMTADPRCSSLPGTNAAHCPGVCLRSLRVTIPVSSSPDTAIEVSGANELGQAIAVHTVRSYREESANPTMFGAHRSLYVYLPAGGSYSARFTVDGTTAIWPRYADLSYEDSPGGCGTDFAAFDIDELHPSCDELVLNGNAGDDVAGGSADGWQYMTGGGVIPTPGGADGSAFSLLNANRAGSWFGIAQFLDTRCFTFGAKYAFRAKVRLTNETDGSLFQCNVNADSSDPQACVRATLRPGYGMTDAEHSWPNVGTMIESDKEWNVMDGVFEVDEFAAGAGTVAVYVNGGIAGVNFQIDSVSMTPWTEQPTAVPTSAPTLHPFALPKDGFPDFHITNADFTGNVTFGGDGSITFFTLSQQDATVVTKTAHSGTGGPVDLDLTVKITNRVLYGSGYQAALALFFAPETVTVADLTTNDSGYANFEQTVVATVRDKLYPTINHVWVHMHYMSADESGTNYQGGGSGYKNMDGYLRLQRSGGFVTASHSPDGSTWKNVGSAVDIPDEYKTAPLKIGMRIKREWKGQYWLEVMPNVTSGGAVEASS